MHILLLQWFVNYYNLFAIIYAVRIQAVQYVHSCHSQTY